MIIIMKSDIKIMLCIANNGIQWSKVALCTESIIVAQSKQEALYILWLQQWGKV